MKDVSPIQYNIHLEPDLNTFSFKGSTNILLEAVEPIHEIGLNDKEPIRRTEQSTTVSKTISSSLFSVCYHYPSTRTEPKRTAV